MSWVGLAAAIGVLVWALVLVVLLAAFDSRARMGDRLAPMFLLLSGAWCLLLVLTMGAVDG